MFVMLSLLDTVSRSGKKERLVDDVTQASETDVSEVEFAREDDDKDPPSDLPPSNVSVDNNASQSPPFSSPRTIPGTDESSTPSTPLRTARDRSPLQCRAPTSAALDKRRGLFGYGTRPVTTPTRSARDSPASAVKTGLEASPMHSARRTALSPVQTAVAVNSSSRHSPSSSSTNQGAARNLFGTVPSNEPVARMFSANTIPDARTAREASLCSPAPATARARSIATSPESASPYRPIQQERSVRIGVERSSARGLATALHTSPMGARVPKPRMLFGDVLTTPPGDMKTGHPLVRSPYDGTRTAREAHSPAQALNSTRRSPYGNNEVTARSARTPSQSMKTARQSPYKNTAREASPARGLPTARGYADRSPANLKTAAARDRSPYHMTTAREARSPAFQTARGSAHSPGQRSLYLAPQMQQDNAAPPAGDVAYTQVITARAVSPAPRNLASPLRPSMTGSDQRTASPTLMTARDALNSTMSCISGGIDSNARWTARSARSPMMVTSRDESKSPLRSARSGYATSRTQSPATHSEASNLITAQGARSPHGDIDSETRIVTAHVLRSPSSMRTGRALSRGVDASPANVRSARESRTSQQLRTAATRTPEHNTMPNSHLREEDSYSEQSQFTFQKTPSGFTQKPTQSAELITGRQSTPTKTDNSNSLYYSARQTTPSRTLRPDVVTLTKRTPKRDFSQHAGLEQPSPIITAVDNNTPNKKTNPELDEMPKCSLKNGCQATHAPRKIPAGPDSDNQDSPSRNAAPKTPERSLRTARGPATRTPSAPHADMRTPRTAHPTHASPASSLHRSPAPSSHMLTAISPDARSNFNNSNEDMATAQHRRPSPRPATARDWAAGAEGPTTAAASQPRVIIRANQDDGKIHVEMCLSFKLNTSGTIRLRGEMVPALQPRAVSVNGQKIWSDRH